MTHANIAKALAVAQLEMGPALKQSVNPAFRSKYADLNSVMDACLPALNKNGIAVIQPMRVDDMGGRNVVTVFLHESGESLECPIPLILGKNDMQGLGSAITYARRFGLMSLAGIAPEDDDGNAAAQNARENPIDGRIAVAIAAIAKEPDLAGLTEYWKSLARDEPAVARDPAVVKAKDARKAALSDPIGDDEIPY